MRRQKTTFCLSAFSTAIAFLLCMSASAEQKILAHGYEVHYIAIPTTFLNPKIAQQYELPRGRDRALVNVSVLDDTGTPVNASVTGFTRNLLSQVQQLEFVEVREPPAIYYLALLRHSDEEHHRFDLTIELPNGKQANVSFQQKFYWDR